jgi:hypothetical protein
MTDLILEPYAVRQHWHIPTADTHWEAILAEYLQTIASRCVESAPCVIGHIKALALFPEEGYVQISVVSPTQPAGFQGQIPAGCNELTLSLNVIVYGPPYALIQDLTREIATHLAQRWNGEVSFEDTHPPMPSEQHHHPHHSTKE